MHLISVIVSHLASFLVITRTLSVACCFFFQMFFSVRIYFVFCILLFSSPSPPSIFFFFLAVGAGVSDPRDLRPLFRCVSEGVQLMRLRSHDNQKTTKKESEQGQKKTRRFFLKE